MRSALLVGAIALSACAATPPAASEPGSVCKSEGLNRFVGQPATEALGAEMLRVSAARTIRWVAQGMMVTMDFSPQRLTVFLTADGRVERANCG